MDFKVNEKVEMKKPHSCGGSQWIINRIGADFKISCIKCGRQVMLSRAAFQRAFKNKVKDEV